MDSSYAKVDHATLQQWAYEMAMEAPISPQGKFLKHQILLTLLRCANHLHDRHLSRGGDKGDKVDTHGIQQCCRLMKKYEDCLSLEARYPGLVEPFRRLNAERLIWRYGEHLTDGAVRADSLAVLFGAGNDDKNDDNYFFEEWQSLFDQHRAERSSAAEDFTDPAESPAPGPWSQPTEILRALTYLIRLQPSEGVYDALDRWVTLRTSMAAGEERDDHRVDAADLVMVELDFEVCSALLGEELGRYADHFREAIDVFCRDVLGADSD